MAAVKYFLARHGLPLGTILLLAIVSAAFSWNVGYEYRWTSDTTDTFYRIINTLPSDAHRGDSLVRVLVEGFVRVFAEKPVTAWYQSLFDAYLRAFHLAWGDISLAYKVQVLPLTLFFGCAAYFFFLYLTDHRGLALALAVAALLPMPLSWAGERSGLGPLWTYTRRYFHTAILPIVALLYFRGALGQRAALLAALALAGASSNLHASGVLLAEGLVLAWLLAEPISPRRTVQAVGLLALAFCLSVTAMGYLWEGGLQTVTRLLLSSMSGEAVATPLHFLIDARQKVDESVRYLFYPPKIYTHLPKLLVDGWLLLTLALSIVPLVIRRCYGKEHFPVLVATAGACLLFVDFAKMWYWVLLGGLLFTSTGNSTRTPTVRLSSYLIIAGFWVAVGGMLVFQAGLALIDGFPVIFNQLRGIRLLGFWVFIWIAALAAPLVARLPESPLVRRLLLAAIGIAVILHGQTAYRQYFRGQDGDRVERKLALLELATWAKAHTPKESVFLVGYSAFGIVSERRIVQTDKSVRNTRIDWLPPKGISPPEETPALAQRYAAGYFLMPAEGVPALLKACVLYANAVYALAATSCGQQQLSGVASAPALAGQLPPGTLQPLQSGAAGQLVGE
jgi:hypothetical protein